MKKTTLFAILLPAMLFGLTYFSNNFFKNEPSKNFHSAEEMAFFQQHGKYFSTQKITGDPLHFLPIDSNILFPIAKTCGGCHGTDSLKRALISTSDVDINMYDDWRSSIMANAARDPFWRAKVSHEMLANPAHSLELQDKCTTCHAPAGNFQAKIHDKKQFYTLADLENDSLGLDGVTCQICHAQSPAAAIGNQHSGNLPFDSAKIRIAYGPYEMMFAPPMHNFVGITPKYGEHILDAGLCAGCHTLLTESVDLQGVKTGSTFVEQATYHEWLNSKYDEDHENTTCQSCHLPRISDEVIIAGGYQNLTPKFPFALHEMAGANVTMLRLMKENREKLKINARPEHFDSTIAATLRMLQLKTLEMKLTPQNLSGDTASFDLKLTNRAGHKFPSGYPSRRAFVEFWVKNAAGDTIFHSGKMSADGSLPDENPNFEPHFDEINAPNQVQIYEMVPGDVAGNFSTILERGHSALKDNRLVPQGFLKSDPVYDTVKIVGQAFADPDFNFSENGSEGSGSDIVHFKIPRKTFKTDTLKICARVWYQSMPPKFLNPVLANSTPQIDSFRAMFSAADRSPILVGEVILDSIFVGTSAVQKIDLEQVVKIFPSPTADGRVFFQLPENLKIRQIKIYDASGRLQKIEAMTSSHRLNWPADLPLELPKKRGVYFIEIQTAGGGRVVKKVVRM